MKGAETLVHGLLANEVDVCFANPGTSEMHFVAALDRIPGIRCVLGLFEGVVTGADSISVAGDRYLVDNGGDISLSVFPLPGAKLNFAVDGHQLSVTVRQGYSQPEDVIAAIVDAINDGK